MRRGIREAKFTWVGSKYRHKNKIRTLAWASLQGSAIFQVSPGLVSSAEVRQAPCLCCPVHPNCDECVNTRHFILFVLVSVLVYNDNGFNLFSQWKSRDREVVGKATDGWRECKPALPK